MKKLSELIWKAKGWGIEGKKGNEITINGKQPLGYEEVQDWARDCIKELEKERGSKELNLYNDAQIIWIKENILEEEQMTLISKKCKTCNNYYQAIEFKYWFTNKILHKDCKICRSKKH